MDRSQLLTLVFTDLAGSTALKRERGDQAAGVIIERHRALVNPLVAGTGARIVDWAGDGCFLTFDAPSAAVSFALSLQDAHARDTELPKVRVGVHLGEVTVVGTRVEGFAVDLASRVCAIALPGQILLSLPAFDSARQRLRSDASGRAIAWRAHGPYLLKGNDEPVEICEAGYEGSSPLTAPPNSERGRRNIAASQEETLGWRPAVGLHVPGRPNWALEQPLGDGGFGEVWLAAQEKTRERRVFKFCFEPERIRGLRREVVLFRLLRETLGARPDIAQILDWEFDKAPYFIESEYTEGGDLRAWAEGKGGLDKILLETRLALITQTAEALGAAHSVGVLHKDIKPGNILVTGTNAAKPQACLTDFGIGLIVNRGALQGKNITAAGLTETLVASSTPSSGGGTRMYMAPELIEGKPASTLSDIYALGVVLYQTVIGDFSRALGPGWERDVSDELLREDIAACVDGDPTRRLSSAAELAKRLQSLTERRAQREAERQRAVDAEKAERQRAIDAEKGHRRRQQLVAAIIIGVLVSAAIAVAGFREAALRREEISARHDAEHAKENAERAMNDAQRARDDAMAAKAESDHLRKEAEYRAYVSDVRLAAVALDQGNPSQARMILTRTNPEYRGWEWGNLAGAAWPDVSTTVAPAPLTASSGTAAERWRGATASLYRHLTLHSASVAGARFSPDGELLVSFANDGSIYCVRWKTGEVLWKTQVTQLGSGDVAFTHDGKWLAHTGELNVFVRNALTGEISTQLNGHTEAVAALAFSPDDSALVSRSLDRTTRLWDWRSGRQIWSLDGQDTVIQKDPAHYSLFAFMPGGSRFLIGDGNDRFHIGDTATGKFISDLPWQLPKGFIPAALSPNADFLIIFNPELMLYRVFDIAAGTVRNKPDFQGNPSFSARTIVVTPDSSLMFFRGILGGIVAFNLESNAPTEPLTVARGLSSYQSMDALAISPDANYIAAPQADGSVFIFALSHDEDNISRIMRQTGPVYVGRFDPIHRQLVTVDLDGGMTAWDYDRRTIRHQWKGHADGIIELEASPDYSMWLTTSYDGTYGLWDNDSTEPIALIKNGIPPTMAGGVKGPLVRLAASLLTQHHFSPDGRRIVVASPQGGAQVLDAKTREPIFSLGGHKSWVYECHYSPKGTMILTQGYQEPFIKIWDANTGQERFTLQTTATIVHTAFSPDESMLVATVLTPTVFRWSLEDGKELPRITIPVSSVTTHFSPNGDVFSVGLTNGTAVLYDAKDGTKKAALAGHAGTPLSAEFNPAGDRILTCGYDKTARVWDLMGNQLSVFTLDEDIHSASWSPDGNQIVITTIQGSVRVLDSIPWSGLAEIGDADTSVDQKLKTWREQTK